MLIDSHRFATVPTNLYTGLNAFARGAGETNSLTGLAGQSGVVIAVESTDFVEGAYSVKFTVADGSSDRVEAYLSFPTSTTITLTWWEKRGASVTINLENLVGFTNINPSETSTGNISGSWVERTTTITTNAASQTLRWYVFGAAGVGYLDGLLIQ